MKNDKTEKLVEAVDALFAAEEEASLNVDRGRWSTVLHNINKQSRRVNNALTDMTDGWFRLDGAECKVFVCAVVYQAVADKLFGNGQYRYHTQEYKRHYYTRRKKIKAALKSAISLYRDVEAQKSGKRILWKIVLRRRGYTYEVLRSGDHAYIVAEYNDLMRNLQRGEMYYIVKEYVDIKDGKYAAEI